MNPKTYSLKTRLPGVYLDGTKINSLGALANPVRKARLTELGSGFECYVFPVGQWLLEYYLCPESTVEVDSARYLTLQRDEDEEVEDHAVGRVIFEKTASYHSTFIGDCELRNVIVSESHLETTELSLEEGFHPEFNIYIQLEAVDCQICNAYLTNGTVLSDCWLHDVGMISLNKEPVSATMCEVQHSKFYTNGIIELKLVAAFNTHINVKDLLKVSSVYWTKVRITGQSINVPSAMFFLEVTLPRIKLFVYKTAEDKWNIAPDIQGDRYSIEVDDPGLEATLESAFQERGQIDTESCLQYLYDCIKSRNTILENIGRFQEQLGRATI